MSTQGDYAAVWPDVAIKRSQISPKVAPNVVTAIFTNKVTLFKIAQKAVKCFGFFCQNNFLQNLSNIAQSGRTAV